MGKFKRVCVFCGRNLGNKRIFSDAALDLGRQLVERKMDLVYGGGSFGLMGLVSQTVFNGGCHVLGVVPTALIPLEVLYGALESFFKVHFILRDTGFKQMKSLIKLSLSLIFAKQQVGLLNIDGYYDALLGLFDKGVEEGFIKPCARNIVISAKNAEELIQKMEDYIPLHDQVASSQSWIIDERNPNL
eukprot:XP_025014521.1 cytokinin riboside 5'-monophosphate phosphoribohydrolase LOG8-like [Ricinus communis]